MGKERFYRDEYTDAVDSCVNEYMEKEGVIENKKSFINRLLDCMIIRKGIESKIELDGERAFIGEMHSIHKENVKTMLDMLSSD